MIYYCLSYNVELELAFKQCLDLKFIAEVKSFLWNFFLTVNLEIIMLLHKLPSSFLICYFQDFCEQNYQCKCPEREMIDYMGNQFSADSYQSHRFSPHLYFIIVHLLFLFLFKSCPLLTSEMVLRLARSMLKGVS